MANYTDPEDAWQVTVYKFGRGVEMYVTEAHLHQLRAALPLGVNIHTEEISEGWFTAQVTEPLDMPVPELEGPRTVAHGQYELQRPWPLDATVNGGKSGLVLRDDGSSYGTAFVEASLTEPATFLRGEAETIEAAEEVAWAKYQRYTANDHDHEFETRGYTNGAGFCKHCGMFKSKVFSLQEIGSVCHVCGDDMYGVIGDIMYCQTHAPDRETRQHLREVARAEGKSVSQLEELLDYFASDEN